MGGWIKSAGTLWLGLPKSQFCIMLDAIFMFHQGSNGTRPASESHRRIYWNNLPRAVRNYITLQHVPAWKKPYPDTNLPWVDWIKVTGSQAVKAGFGRPCTADTKVNIFGGSHSDG